ncbi:FAD-binding domain-containing protein [Dendrothele bispora CBS 962.96]|uniref:FAD-binding domain-containing protein n=1 Tax=Dendrothele bispora (strain CBS 962.96) TaxID=1314807 RepID=A0A4S8LQQ2_DENBC|nr:FAD-binding domain-containing protein [Dendrothele bispora CBS 962.96]
MWAQPQHALFLCLLTTSCSFVSSSFIKRTSEPVNTLAACNRLQGLLGNTIVESSAGPDYNATVNSPRNLFNTEFLPTCVILVTEAADVQVAMKTIFEYEVDYAVLAGGHSANIGWDAVNGGILISFERMTQVSYDATKDTITLQPGARWGPSAMALAPQGVAPVGGRVDDVGTGLLLGGGLSFLSPGHGFASDNYVELEVVLVDGTLVTATANNQYADLFRALKGGANRFGIVTRYEVKAIHTGTPDEKTWFGGSVTYPESSFEALARVISHFVHNNDNPNAVHLSIYERINIDGLDTTIATSWLFYNGTELPKSVFGEFLSIPTLTSNLTSLSYLDVALALAGSSTPGQGVAWGSTALVGNELVDDLYLETVRLWLNFSNTFVSQIPISTLAFTPVTLSQISYGRERGRNAIDPPLIGYNAILQTINLPEGQKTVPKDVEEGRQSLLQQLPTSPGIPLYVNECDSEQEVFATYGGFEFLKSTYAKYDPTRFNIRHMDGPKGL